MACNYFITIDFSNCKTEEEKRELLEKKLKRFNRKVTKSGAIQKYIENQHFLSKKEKRKLKREKRLFEEKQFKKYGNN